MLVRTSEGKNYLVCDKVTIPVQNLSLATAVVATAYMCVEVSLQEEGKFTIVSTNCIMITPQQVKQIFPDLTPLEE